MDGRYRSNESVNPEPPYSVRQYKGQSRSFDLVTETTKQSERLLSACNKPALPVRKACSVSQIVCPGTKDAVSSASLSSCLPLSPVPLPASSLAVSFVQLIASWIETDAHQWTRPSLQAATNLLELFRYSTRWMKETAVESCVYAAASAGSSAIATETDIVASDLDEVPGPLRVLRAASNGAPPATLIKCDSDSWRGVVDGYT